jgi:hypothetical protein
VKIGPFLHEIYAKENMTVFYKRLPGQSSISQVTVPALKIFHDSFIPAEL